MGSSGESSFEVRLTKRRVKGKNFLVGELDSNGSLSKMEEIALYSDGDGRFGRDACDDDVA